MSINLEVTHAKVPEPFEKKALRSIKNLLSRTDLGFLQLPHRPDLWHQTAQIGNQIRESKSQLAVVGIGGSSLGGRAIYSMSWPQLDQALFFEDLDQAAFSNTWRRIRDFKKIHWMICSKSGTTLETLTLANLISAKLEGLGESLKANCTVVTETTNNPLGRWARENSLEILEIPENVGGRFSVLSPVGLLPASVLGHDLEEVRKGASEALLDQDFVVKLAAQVLYSFDRAEWITVFWSYSSQLSPLTQWLQQLWSESLAKHTTRNRSAGPRVSTPLVAVGPRDQHSMLQQFMEGAKDKMIWFFSHAPQQTELETVKADIFGDKLWLVGKTIDDVLQAERRATIKALGQSQVSCLDFQLESLDSQMVGRLFMLFEILTGTLGEALDINAYDQPGVELGKKLAKEILSN